MEIGIELGLTVPKEHLVRFPKHLRSKLPTGPKPLSGWGTQIGKEEYSLNRFFAKNEMPLKYTYRLPDMKNPRRFITDLLKNDRDAIACFNYKKLYGGKSGDWGHVSLIEAIEGEDVILLEPEPKLPRRRTVKVSDLIDSMKYHGQKNSGGFWVFSPTKR